MEIGGHRKVSERNDEGIIKVDPPLRPDIRAIRILICCGLFCMVIFIIWFINPEHIGYSPIFWLLTFALAFKLLKMVHEWYHYWKPSVPVMPQSNREWKVDILTTACPGEPTEMIIRTLKAMKAIRYPHTNYLCDEGDDPYLKEVCLSLGVIHVTRIEKTNAKAGNINNALNKATGEIAVVLDPDHVPVPEFLDRVLPYFEDPMIGYVQCVQAYGNQSESFIAKGAAEQTYHFYGPMMMCMNSYGTVQAIGANCTFRRKALDSIGGHAAGLAEDMHTAMQLHAKGWKSVYVPEILTRGLVPATLSSYYKQQLKWSRGVFELLFRTFPKLHKHFTWRQKFHYFSVPMYFLFGLINLIDIVVPLLALAMAEVPWEVNLTHFAGYFTPVCAFSLCIRLYAQRWLVEKQERGFHFAGGILRMATWWIFLIGFIYAIFNVKVPYLPTPKEDEHTNQLGLSIPNIIVIAVCGLFILYGLSIDWTPYSLVMAGYSLLTICMLAFTICVSQQKFILTANNICGRIPGFRLIKNSLTALTIKSQQLVYSVLKEGMVILIFIFSLAFYSYSGNKEEDELENGIAEKESGGFYIGTELQQNEGGIKEINSLPINESTFNLFSFTQKWNDTLQLLSVERLNNIREKRSIPYISWQLEKTNNLSKVNSYSDICKGNYDVYLKRCAALLRNYKDPVFISFTNTNQQDKPSAKQFIQAWQYVYTFFNDLGISNVTWVWCPDNINEEKFYPGEKFVDWIGVSCLNYGKNIKSKDWYSFSAIYNSYNKCYGKFKKPVMITGFGSAKGPDQANWINKAFDDISNKYREVKSVIIKCNKIQTKTIWKDSIYLTVADFTFANSSSANAIYSQMQNKFFRKTVFAPVKINPIGPQNNYHSDFITGGPGKFKLLINKQPYFIRGVAYNTAHDWRDGNMPLTRRQVVKDFENIKNMGANTIRRYGFGIYDRNILNIAEEFNLNVLFGFWFDPKVDFYSDSLKVQAYIKEVEEKVIEYKDHSSIIAWSLGNESWGLLKHRFAKPYLTKVRSAYVQLIEYLAQRIHQIDPTRPVFSCMEHEEYQLPGELVAFRDGAPSVDVMGINSYYKEQISKLNHVARQFDSLRPYLVSEFGPSGYWDPKYNKTSGGSIIEQTDSEKSEWYKEQWISYVKGCEGFNIGGFAYCWHDRMEGSYTWFGLTDYKGRPKPAYYALKEQWINKKEETLPQFIINGAQQMVSGNVYYFTATTNGAKTNLNYEWCFLKDNYLTKVNTIKISDDPSVITLTAPEEPSDYKLYVFITDKDKKRVTAASIPLRVNPVFNAYKK